MLGILLAMLYPGCRGLVGAKEYELVRKTTLVSYLEHLEKMGFKYGVDYSYNKVDKIIKFSNGSEILFSALDDPEKFKSLNLHWAEIEEASQINDSSFKQLLGRLRNTYRGKNWVDFRYRLFGHTNPQGDKGWIWQRFVEHSKENYRLIIAPTTNNIGYPQGRVIADSKGNKTVISSSEYAKFAYFYLPGADKNGIANCPKYVGDVVGILGYYSDNARYDPASDDWAISIRSLDDLQLYHDANGNNLTDDDERTAENLWPRIEYTK